jgi:hypothetical protein
LVENDKKYKEEKCEISGKPFTDADKAEYKIYHCKACIKLYHMDRLETKIAKTEQEKMKDESILKMSG